MPTERSRLGKWGEAQAGRFLQKKGYHILATNYCCARGEVDIVARDREDLVFVEVRTRQSADYGTPEESLTAAKVQRLLATSQDYLQRHAEADTGWRIDLVCIYLGPGRRLQHIDHLQHAVQL